MKTTTITYKKQKIVIRMYPKTALSNLITLESKLNELSLDFQFRKKIKIVLYIELIRETAILYYADGTKLYL